MDRFATLVIVLALRAVAANPGLWNQYNTGDNLLFRRADFKDPRTSSLLRDLSAIASVRELSERFADVCQDDYAHVPLLDDFLASAGPHAPPPPLLKPAHVVVLNRLYGVRPRPKKSAPRSWKLRRKVAQQAVAFSSDGSLVATGDDEGKISIREASTGRSRRDQRIKRAPGSIRDLAITRGGGVVAVVASGGNVGVWDATAVRELQLFRGIRGVRAAALSSGGGWVASGTSDGTLRCWSVSNGRLVAACSALSRVNAVAISPDGRLLASASARGGVDLWEVPGGRRVNHLAVDRGVTCLAFTSDGQNLAVGTSSGQVSVWHISGDPSSTVRLPGAFPLMRSLAVSADGQHLAATGGDGSIWMRRLPVEMRPPVASRPAASHRLLDWLRRVALL